MRRSLACFRKAGITIDPFATNPISDPRSFSPNKLLIPSLEAIGMWQILLKEWVGFVAYWLVGYI